MPIEGRRSLASPSDGERVVRQERLLTELGERVRVRAGPDGLVYLLSDNPEAGC